MLKSKVAKLVTATAVMAITAVPAFAEFPARPVQVIVPYSAGGSTDLSMRLLADSFKRNIKGSTMVIRNQPGGGGSIGVSATIHGRADGYTLGAGAQVLFLCCPTLAVLIIHLRMLNSSA